jgi:pyridoxal phosphate enzyme (YggS family)
MSIAERLHSVRDRVDAAAARTGRRHEEIRLVAVSKAFGVPEILEARAAGQSVFGENRAQEFADKHSQISDGIEWHFVGTLQTNKVKYVVGAAALVHSVDSLRLAQAIGKRASSAGVTQDVLIEVNVAGDERKAGLEPGSVRPLIDRIEDIEGVRVRGLMTIPPLPDDPEDSRPHYKELAALGTDVAPALEVPPELSMGMTRDFEVAIEEGATLIRVGEAIFGPRNPRS